MKPHPEITSEASTLAIPTTEKDLLAKGGWVFFIWGALEARGYTIRLRRNDMRFSNLIFFIIS